MTDVVHGMGITDWVQKSLKFRKDFEIIFSNKCRRTNKRAQAGRTDRQIYRSAASSKNIALLGEQSLGSKQGRAFSNAATQIVK